MATCACLTLITTPSYVVGAEVLGLSLRRSGWPHETAVMVTPNIGAEDRERLGRYWQRIVDVEPIANPNPPETHGTAYFETLYTRLRLWELTEYEKVISLDADTIVMGPLEDLLDRPDFAAAPCMGALDGFNGGVLVANPSTEVFQDMRSKVSTLTSYDGSEQGFLNSYFHDWYTGPAERRLPAIYNVPHILYYYHVSWNRLREDMRVLHFFGAQKPWAARNWVARTVRKSIQRRIGKLGRGKSPRDLWWSFYRELAG